jgi:hypothetical protein
MILDEQAQLVTKLEEEYIEIPMKEFNEIKNLKITNACTLMKRLSPPPFTPLNHFGILV